MLLSSISSPVDLKRLSLTDLPQLCAEIREFIIAEVSENPGHFGASLGAVELAVALHYVYDTPEDKIIWDVGHQAYAHKILTGRRENFRTNRKLGGISGFPRMCESIYDAFGTGHSSTSISAALGMAVAARLAGKCRHIAAIIGDGAMTGGMAFEGMNHAGMEQADMLVILNDNNISIDKSTGALSHYLVKITTSPLYNKVKNKIWLLTSRNKHLRLFFQKTVDAFKGSVLRSGNLFEALNFRYFGPIDGHDVVSLVKVLRRLKKVSGAKILHILTIKGKGYLPAEKNQTLWHAPGTFNPSTGERQNISLAVEQPLRYQHVFGETILELARQNTKIVGITPAMLSGSSLDIMMAALPQRVFDVGIAEQHAVTFAAGMAAAGYTPLCCVYSSFLQRAYDSIIHDVALQCLPVIFCIDRAGLVGEDGATHHGIFDLAMLRSIPNMVVAAPMNEQELRNMLYTAQRLRNAPFAIRYPRGNGVMTQWRTPFEEIPVGKAMQVCDGSDIAILAIGQTGNFAMQAAATLKTQGISAAVWNMQFLKPIDQQTLHYVATHFSKVITTEDGIVNGGLGSAATEFFSENGYATKVIRLGIVDTFPQHGTAAELQAECGFDAAGITAAAIKLCKQ